MSTFRIDEKARTTGHEAKAPTNHKNNPTDAITLFVGERFRPVHTVYTTSHTDRRRTPQ